MKKAPLMGLIFLFSISIVFAAQPLPHAFEGEIFSNDGSLTSGKTLIATLAGTVTGQTTIDGNSFKITVIDHMGSGGLIEFFMGDEKADLAFYFKTFEVTKTNLTFDTIPDETIGSCGDGICAIEECSFCAIDCPISKCKNNNVCDAAIGEDYITAPNDCNSCGDGICNNYETCTTCAGDCGVCPTNTDDGSGGGGSSGGGESSSLLSSNNEYVNIDTINSESNETQDNVGGGMTGAAVGSSENVNFLPLLILLVLVLAGIILFSSIKKSKKRKVM